MHRTPNDRRHFLSTMGKTALAAGLTQPLLATAAGSAPPAGPGPALPAPEDFEPVKLGALDDSSEKTKPPLAAPLNRSQKIGFAIVGLGHLTLEEILPAFAASLYAKPVALVSGDSVKAQKVARQFSIDPKAIYDYQNFEEIKNNPDIQAVYIVLPNAMHEEFTIRAAKAGKHVLCEKPMSVSSASARRMIDACEQAAKKLMIAYRIQYEPKNRLLREWTRTKKFGDVRVIEAFNSQHIGDPAQWRLKKSLSGGGSLPDIGLYCLNTCRYLLGEEPEWVQASTYSTPGDQRFAEVEEAVMFHLGFPGGAQVSCTTSYGVHESRRYRCLTDKGAWFGMQPAFPYHGLAIEMSRADGGIEWNSKPDPGDKNQFALELDHFALCIFFDKKPFTPGEEGLQDQKIMEAIYASAAAGKRIMLEKISGTDRFRGTPAEDVRPS